MAEQQTVVEIKQGGGPSRRRLPDERAAMTHKFSIVGYEGYLTVGLYENGQPGEIFLVMAREGSTISGFADAFARAVSLSLQYGVPLQELVDTFSHTRFEPSGVTKHPEIRFAKSIVDYIFRFMALKFLTPEGAMEAEVLAHKVRLDSLESNTGPQYPEPPPCATCGAVMVPSGTAWMCSNCGNVMAR